MTNLLGLALMLWVMTSMVMLFVWALSSWGLLDGWMMGRKGDVHRSLDAVIPLTGVLVLLALGFGAGYGVGQQPYAEEPASLEVTP